MPSRTSRLLRDAARADGKALSKIAEGNVDAEASEKEGEDGAGKEPDENEEPGDKENGKGAPETVKTRG